MNRKVVRLRGLDLELFAERAAFLLEKKWLLIADAHLGKAEKFRQMGAPVPKGTTKSDLDRLSQLIETTHAETVVALGDLFHCKPASESDLVHTLRKWRRRHLKIKLLAVEGNHDKNAGEAFEAMGISGVYRRLEIGGLVLAHKPFSRACKIQSKYLLAGHVHPTLRAAGIKNHRESFACFYFGRRQGLLPAFGAFTGAGFISPGPGDHVFVCSGKEIHAVRF